MRWKSVARKEKVKLGSRFEVKGCSTPPKTVWRSPLRWHQQRRRIEGWALTPGKDKLTSEGRFEWLKVVEVRYVS